MRLIDDFHNFWRFWSVRWGLLAGAFSASGTAYATLEALTPRIVAGVPQWTLTVCVVGAMVSTFASVMSRGVVQEKLPSKACDRPTVPEPLNGRRDPLEPQI